MTDDASKYEVGYGKPPQHAQFKPGRSGNPKGRAKGALNLKTDLTEELSERIRIREGTKERSVTKQRAMLKALLAKALKGDTRAIAVLLSLVAKLVEPDAASSADKEVGDTSDQLVFAELMSRLDDGRRPVTSKSEE